MKSLTTNVFWPAWEWGPRNKPSTRYVCASYSESLTIRDNRKTRNLIKSRWYQELWGDRYEIVSDQDNKIKFENDHTGFKIATSVTGLGTGERGDRFIIDDPHNVSDGESEAVRGTTLRWFTETVPTRVNDQVKSPIIVIMQRVHDQDVSGLILEKELGYEHLMLPLEFEPERRCYSTVKPSYIKNPEKEKVYYNRKEKSWQHTKTEDDLEPRKEKRFLIDIREEENELLWPERIPREVVERDKKAMGEYAVAGQFQQRPAPRGGGMFKREWFEVVPAAPVGCKAVRGWDLAASTTSTSPYTSGVRMSKDRDGTIYIEDVARFRASPGKVEKSVKNISTNDGYSTRISIPQDPGQAGKSQKRAFANLLHGFDVRFSPESGDKVTRANPLAAQAEAGNVKLVRGQWNEPFLEELCVFPAGKYKDQTDAASRAYMELNKKGNRLIGASPQLIGEQHA